MPSPDETDFQQPIREEGLTIFRSFEDATRYTLLPDVLMVAERSDKRPDFLLELVRGQKPQLPPEPYGLLDMRLRPAYRMEKALGVLRNHKPGAMLQETSFVYGFIRLSPSGDVGDAPKELFQPVPLTWNGLGTARFVLRLPLPAALLLKGALLGEILPIRAIAEMFISGVSPRLPISVRFDPAQLIGKLIALGNNERQVVWQDIVQFLRRDVQTLPFEIIKRRGEIETDRLAEAMADRVCQRFAKFIPSPKADAQPYVVLQAPADVGSGQFEWDLSEPITVTRPLVLSFDPLEVARLLIRDVGADTVIQQTIVPPIKIGTLPVNITANLPAQRLGVLALGVNINAAPHPPHRPQAIIETAELAAPKDSATVLLRFSPAEQPEYTFSTLVIVEDEMKRYEGRETRHSGNRLDLQPGDFPVTFVLIEATTDLLELASIQGVCRRQQKDSNFKQAFELNLAQASVAIAVPEDAKGTTVDIEARSKDGGQTLLLNSLPAESLRLGLTSFREYGPHEVEIEAVFTGDVKLVAIDLLPEGKAEARENIATLHFTPAQPKRAWNWFARSPFAAGYRYRVHRNADTPAAAWSQPQSPFERLIIDANLLAGGGA
jgi:hypothetical protein